MSEPESKTSSAYYLLPILLGILGGVIGYFVLKNRDAKKARNCLLVGIGITAVGTAGLIAMGSTSGPEFDRPITVEPEMRDSMPGQVEDFIDSAGYTPDWAAGKGEHQISSVCLNVNTMEDIDTPDWRWCNEYFGHLLDQGSARDSSFVDSTGYTPDWAAGKGENQISSICSNINTMEDIDTPDWRWCNEFVGYLLDTMSSPGADRMPAGDKMPGSTPTYEPVDSMPVQAEGFVDLTGYMPEWAEGKDKTQISSICTNEDTFESINTPDWRWCNEYLGYLLDSGSTRNSDFADSTGYTPDWTAGKGEHQIASVCLNVSTMEDIDTPDWRWCNEYLGYLLDSGSAPTHEPVDPMPVQAEGFVDLTGYMPEWTEGKDKTQISSICTNEDTFESINTPDWRWCNEYLGYLLDAGSTRNSDFVDSLGHAPGWAAGKGENQLSSICTNKSTMEETRTSDWYWCKEFLGYLLDSTGPAQDGEFADSTGYTPDWAAGKGKNQITPICTYKNTVGYMDTPDWGWCNEFFGYLIDSSPEGLALSDFIMTPPSLEPVPLETVIQEPEHASADDLANFYIMRIKELTAIKNRDLAECGTVITNDLIIEDGVYMVYTNDLSVAERYIERIRYSSINVLTVVSHISDRSELHGIMRATSPHLMEYKEVQTLATYCFVEVRDLAQQIRGYSDTQEEISQSQAERGLEAGPEPEEHADLNDIYISKIKETAGLVIETYEERLKVDMDDLDSVDRWANNVTEKMQAAGLLLDEIGPGVESDPRFIPAQTELLEAIDKADQCRQAKFVELDP